MKAAVSIGDFAVPTPRPQEGRLPQPGTLELVLFEHQDGRYAAAMQGADFLAGDPAWRRAGPVTVPMPAAEGPQAAAGTAPSDGLPVELHKVQQAAYDVCAILGAIRDAAELAVNEAADPQCTGDRCSGLADLAIDVLLKRTERVHDVQKTVDALMEAAHV